MSDSLAYTPSAVISELHSEWIDPEGVILVKGVTVFTKEQAGHIISKYKTQGLMVPLIHSLMKLIFLWPQRAWQFQFNDSIIQSNSECQTMLHICLSWFQIHLFTAPVKVFWSKCGLGRPVRISELLCCLLPTDANIRRRNYDILGI